MEEKRVLRRFDLVFSILLMVGSIFYTIESIKLFLNPFGRPWDKVTEETTAEIISKWYESPALLPFIISILLFICAIILLRIALKDGARFDFLKKDLILKLKENKELKTFFIVVPSLAVYIYFLIPTCRKFLNVVRGFQGFPFVIATFIFMSFLSILFSKRTKRDILMGFVVSFIAAFAITLLFNKVALLPMP